MPVMSYTETLVVTSCWCGINVGIPDNLDRWARQRTDHGVYCPLGHQFFYNDSYEEKLKREQRAHEATRELLAAEERSHTATRGHLTRQKKRIAGGVCPCCHRSFQNLRRHMTAKHPDYSSA